MGIEIYTFDYSQLTSFQTKHTIYLQEHTQIDTESQNVYTIYPVK